MTSSTPSWVARISASSGNQQAAVISSRNDVFGVLMSASSFAHSGSHSAFHVVGLSGTRLVLETSVMYHDAAPTPTVSPASLVLDEPVGQVLRVGHVVDAVAQHHVALDRPQQAGVVEHRHVGRHAAGAHGLLELHDPGVAARFGDRLDLDAGVLGEAGVERGEVLLEEAAERGDLDLRPGEVGRCRRPRCVAVDASDPPCEPPHAASTDVGRARAAPPMPRRRSISRRDRCRSFIVSVLPWQGPSPRSVAERAGRWRRRRARARPPSARRGGSGSRPGRRRRAARSSAIGQGVVAGADHDAGAVGRPVALEVGRRCRPRAATPRCRGRRGRRR